MLHYRGLPQLAAEPMEHGHGMLRWTSPVNTVFAMAPTWLDVAMGGRDFGPTYSRYSHGPYLGRWRNRWFD